jgi:hypothetical protein
LLQDISSLSVLKRLSVIELLYDFDDSVSEEGVSEDGNEEVDHPTSTERQEIIVQAKCNVARAILADSAGTAPKRVKLSYWEDITEM